MKRDSFPDRNAFMLPPLDHVPVEPEPDDGYCLVCGAIVCIMLAIGNVGIIIGLR